MPNALIGTMAASVDSIGAVAAAVPLQVRSTRGHSCFSCYQRKVKCDGKRPCSRCTKSGAECRSERPGRSPRPGIRSTTVTNSSLMIRLRRYEKLLVTHGVRIETRLDEEDEVRDTGSPANESEDGRVIMQGGNPRFIDKYESFDASSCLRGRVWPWMLTLAAAPSGILWASR
jgi:hypothetical protein